MDIKKDLERLEEKWGQFEKATNYVCNGKMPFVSGEARLNVLFDPCFGAQVEDCFACQLKAPVLEELKRFYQVSNGCRLFFGSLSVFGIACHPEDDYEPFDLFRENTNLVSKLGPLERRKCTYVFFASLGGDYVFGYDKKQPSKVFGFKPGSLRILQEFPSFDDFWKHYFEGLFVEYDDDCRKIHRNEEDAGIPFLEHLTHELF